MCKQEIVQEVITKTKKVGAVIKTQRATSDHATERDKKLKQSWQQVKKICHRTDAASECHLKCYLKLAGPSGS